MNIQPKLTVILVANGCNSLDLSGPLQVFLKCNQLRQDGEKSYDAVVVSTDGEMVTTSCGLKVATVPIRALINQQVDTLILPGGYEETNFHPPSDLVSIIQTLTPQVHRLCALSTGIFLLAEAGQLNTITSTVHWNWEAAFRRRYPDLVIDADSLFIRDGKIWTSAGLASGLDLALSLIEQDYGQAIAVNVARHLVMFNKRPGLQSQFSISLQAQSADDNLFTDLHAYMACHLRDDLSIGRLAEEVCMAPRTFARTYVRRVGRTPAKTVEAMRLEAACRALENTSFPIKTIASKVGLISEISLYRIFRKAFKISPTEYRSEYSASGYKPTRSKPTPSPFTNTSVHMHVANTETQIS